jgi:hypothetical protein
MVNNITYKNLKTYSYNFNKQKTNKVLKNVNTKSHFKNLVLKSDYQQNKKQVFKKVVTSADVSPFFNFFLPEKNVLGVTSIIQKDGTNYQATPSFTEFETSTDKWYEVDALVENTVFIEDPTKPVDEAGVKVGRYLKTENRFITEYTPEGFLKIQFGAGTVTPEDQLRQFTTVGVPLKLQNYQIK